MCGKPASRPASSSRLPALAARDRMILTDLARRRGSSSVSRAERRLGIAGIARWRPLNVTGLGTVGHRALGHHGISVFQRPVPRRLTGRWAGGL